MSKLAHSNQETMDEIDIKRAIEDGNEDLIENINCPRCHQVIMGKESTVECGKSLCPFKRVS